MRTVLTQAAGAAAILGAAVLASTVQAADVRPAVAGVGPEVHKMVILNGPTYTARYFSTGLSDTDQAALRDLERAENDADYAQDLQALRRQYVAQELSQSANRATVQQGLYGRSVTRSRDFLAGISYGPGFDDDDGLDFAPGFAGGGFDDFGGIGRGRGRSAFAGSSSSVNRSLSVRGRAGAASGFGRNGGLGFGRNGGLGFGRNRGLGFGRNGGLGFSRGFGRNGGLGFGTGLFDGGFDGYGGYGFPGFVGGSSSVNQSLANGVGDEGVLKTAMAPVIAAQAGGDFAASADHAYTTALKRAASSDALRTALGMGRPGVATPAAAPEHVTLTLKGGDKIDGDLIDEDNDWMTVHTPNDKVSVRKAEVTRIDRHLPGK